MALDDWCLPEDDRPLVSDESPTCGLHRGADDRWNAPGLASVVRLRVCSASVLGSRLLETAGRLEDPLDRPNKVELENYTSFKGQVLQASFMYVCTQNHYSGLHIFLATTDRWDEIRSNS